MKLTAEEKAERKRIKKEKRDKRNKVILTIIFVIFGLFLILDGLSKIEQATNGNTDAPADEQKQSNIEYIQEPAFVTGEYDVRYVSGKIKNNTGRDYDYCQIVIALYDADGNLLGTTLDNTNSFKKDVTWLFNAIVTYENAVSFEVDSVDYY